MVRFQRLNIFIFFHFFLFSALVVYAQDDDLSFAALKKAKDYINISQYQNAVNTLNDAVKKGIANWEVFQTLGISYIKLKRPADAIKSLTKSLELKPDETDTQKALGAIYVNKAKEAQAKGKTSEKIDYLIKACHAYPGGTKIWQGLFQNWFDAGEYQKIKDEGDFLISKMRSQISGSFDEALQESLVIIAKSYYKTNDIEKTELFLGYADSIRVHNDGLYLLKREIKQLRDNEAKKVAEEASNYYTNKDFDKALELYKKLASMPSDKPVDPYEKIELIEKDKKYNAIITSIEQAIKEQDWGKALDLAESGMDNFPDEEEIGKKYDFIKAKFEEEEAKLESIRVEKERIRSLKIKYKGEYNAILNSAEKKEENGLYADAIVALKTAILKVEEARVQNCLEDIDVSKLNERISELEDKKKKFDKNEERYSNKINEIKKHIDNQNYTEAYDLATNLKIEFGSRHEEDINMYLAEAAAQLGKNNKAKINEAKELVDSYQNIKIDSNDSDEVKEQKKYKQCLYDYINALCYISDGDYKNGFVHLDKVINANPNFKPGLKSIKIKTYYNRYFPALVGIVLLFIALIIKKSISWIKQYMRDSLIRKVERIREKGDYENHIKFLEEHFQKADLPDMRTVTLLLAGALLKKDEPQRAFNLASELLKRESKNPLAKKIAGEACMALEAKTPAALEHIQNLYRLDESRKDIVMYLANAYMEAGADNRAAQEFIGKAVTLNPAETDFLLYLADIYINKQNYNTQTIKTIERAVKITQEEPKYYKALIDNYKKIGDFPNAEKWQDIAQSKFPNEPMFDPNATQNAFGGGSFSSSYGTFDNGNTYGGSGLGGQDFFNQTMQSQKPQTSWEENQKLQQQVFEQAYSQPNQTTQTNQQDNNDFIQQQYYDNDSQNNEPVSKFGGMPKISGFGSLNNENTSFNDNASSNSNLGGLPNIFLPTLNEQQNQLTENDSDSIPNIPNIPPSPQKNNTATSGPQRACPHCGAANSITEYYCNSCGRPLM